MQSTWRQSLRLTVSVSSNSWAVNQALSQHLRHLQAMRQTSVLSRKFRLIWTDQTVSSLISKSASKNAVMLLLSLLKVPDRSICSLQTRQMPLETKNFLTSVCSSVTKSTSISWQRIFTLISNMLIRAIRFAHQLQQQTIQSTVSDWATMPFMQQWLVKQSV